MKAEIEKAKKRIYKHKSWFIDGDKTIYEAIKHFAECRDFVIDYKRNLTTYDVSRLGYNRRMVKSEVLKWLIDERHYDSLIIRFTGSEGGTDRGKFKIKLFLHLRGLQN